MPLAKSEQRVKKGVTLIRNRIVQLELKDGKANVRQKTYLPPDKWFLPVNVSPSGSRILWIELELYKPLVGWQRIWEDYTSRLGLDQLLTSSRRTARFWTSDANGENLRLLGREPLNKSNPSAFVTRAIWTPDERHITYLFNNTLFGRDAP